MMGAGRPTKFTPEIGDLICDRLASGMSLRRACKFDDVPDVSNVVLWLLKIDDPKFDEFRARYANARSVQYELLADEIVDIADDGTSDYMEDEGGPRLNPEAIARSRLRVDTRKWFLGKVLPKFSDKQESPKAQTDDAAALLSKLIDKLPG